MEKYCDNRSVGVILTNDHNEYALLTRGRFPIGIAPPAGHIDGHGSPEQAAIDEVGEELGVALAIDGLRRSAIMNRRVENVCRREGGDYHIWNVYEACVDKGTVLLPDPLETNGAKWYTDDEVALLAERTRLYSAGKVSDGEWAARPGLEPVWLDFLQELGHINR